MEAFIKGFRPHGVGPDEAAFAQSVVLSASPVSVGRAKSLLWATSRLGAFGTHLGLELRPEVLLRVSVIERFLAKGCDSYSHAARRTVRSNLLWVNRRLFAVGPDLAPFSRERASAPYSPQEISSYLRLADTQPTVSRRMRASALICLGAGAGLLGSDLRLLRGTDLCETDGAVVVYVRGPNARAVPLRAEFSGRALVASSFAGAGFIIGGAEPSRRNLTTQLLASMSGGADLGRMSLSRLRSTWLVACAKDIGLATFMAAAGVRCSQRLGDLVSHLDPGDTERAIEVLGGRC